MKRILLLSEHRPEPGYGTGERILSIDNALRKLAEVHLLILPPPNRHFQARPGENVVRLLDSPSQATRWFWRKQTYLLRDLRPNRRVAEAVAGLHRQYKFDAFFGRLQYPILGACASLGPTYVDLDMLGTPRAKSFFSPMNHLRRAALEWSLARFACVFVTKQSDADKIRHPNVRVLPCISTQQGGAGLSESASDGRRVLFVGGFYGPNQEGLIRFVQRSLPSIRGRVPNTVLRVVGAHNEEFLDVLRQHKGVEPAGFVTDLTAEYHEADICICPIWRGEGANVKLAEYAAFGRAIVATTFSAHGYEGILEPDRDLLVADSDEELADRCVELLIDQQQRQRLARNAKMVASTTLSQTAIDRIIEEVVGPSLR